MRRKTRLGLAVLVPLLVAFGLYAGYWFTIADRLKHGLAEWAEAAPAQHLDVSWQKAEVGGFPFSFRVELRDVHLSDARFSPAPELHLPRLSGSTAPWNFREWSLAAPHGFAGEVAGAGQRPPIKFAADAATGAVAVDANGRATIWLNAQHPRAEAALSIAAQSADCWLVLPTHAASAHTDPSLGAAVLLRNVQAPIAPAPFGGTIDEIGVGATLLGGIPSGPLPAAIAAWRDAGGTLELDNFHLEWGALGITANGTVALDGDMQPTASVSGTVQGYDQIIAALAASGRVHGDLGLARLGLAMLAKSGPNGRPEIRTSFTIQNGEMRLGPMKLGPAPKIVWQ
jgi:hypothetical protein